MTPSQAALQFIKAAADLGFIAMVMGVCFGVGYCQGFALGQTVVRTELEAIKVLAGVNARRFN